MSRGPVRIRRFTAVGLAVLCALAASEPAFGQTISWTSQFGTTGFDAIYALDDEQGDVFGVGEAEGALPGQTWAGSCDTIVRGYRGSGQVKWTRQFGTSGCDFSEAIAAAPSSVYAGGAVAGALPGQAHSGALDAYARKYDEDGNELWTRQFGSAGNDFVRGAAADAAAVYVVGSVRAALPGQAHVGAADAYVRKYDGAGNELWSRQFGTSAIDAAREIDVAADGVVVVGQVEGALPGQQSQGGTDVFIRKYDGAGNEVWTRQFGTAGEDVAWGVDVEDGAIYVGGDVAGALPGQAYAGGSLDAFIRKYDAAGNELWTRQFGTGGFDRTIRVAAHGTRVFAVGRVGGALPGQNFAGGATDPFVRLYAADGNEGWTLQFGGTQEPEAATGVAVEDHGGDLFVSGGVGGALSGQPPADYIDAFVMKILPG